MYELLNMGYHAFPYLKEKCKTQCAKSGTKTPEFGKSGRRDDLKGERGAVNFHIWLLLKVES